MRGTDPTKSKWECPIMFYICSLYTDVSLNIIKIYLFVIVDSSAICYLIYVEMYKLRHIVPNINTFLYLLTTY